MSWQKVMIIMIAGVCFSFSDVTSYDRKSREPEATLKFIVTFNVINYNIVKYPRDGHYI